MGKYTDDDIRSMKKIMDIPMRRSRKTDVF